MLYLSTTYPNTGNDPISSPGAWTQYFGPITVSLWNENNTTSENSSYFAGELVYTPANEQYVVYLSMTNGNTDTPGVYPAWSATQLYNVGDTVIIPPSPTIPLMFDPGAVPVAYDPGAVPVVFDPADGSGPWQCIRDLNIGINPVGDTTGSWVLLPNGQPDQRTGFNWLALDCAVQSINIVWPAGAGPSDQASTRNIYRLPFGYLRRAPQEPPDLENGCVFRGALQATGWEYNGAFVVTWDSGPIPYRFVADIADVTMMDDMFCEGLAARVGKEGQPILNPKLSVADKQLIVQAYKDTMFEARQQNGIEQGPVEPPEDEYLLVRL
jgi:hypothetical protein